MVAFMVLNIICFVLDGIASVLILIVIGIWAAIVDAVTNDCKMLPGNTHCECVYKGKKYDYKGMHVLPFSPLLPRFLTPMSLRLRLIPLS